MKRDINIPEGYELIWSDDFRGDALSFNEWNEEIHPRGKFFHELQEYVASERNIFVRDGHIYICPAREQQADGSVKFTSGRISTAGRHEYRYGYFEARIKAPKGTGLRPVFSLSSDVTEFGSWPRYGEIDIMEFNCTEPNLLYGTVHSGSEDDDTDHFLQQGIYKFTEENAPDKDFHVYACEWEPGKIRLFVDGTEYFSCEEPAGYDHPFYLVFGVAVGGDWPGDPDSETVFDESNSLCIDYVRVFHKADFVPQTTGKRRKMLGVCGVWQDAENFNMFLRNLICPELTKDYVVSVFTFDLNSQKDAESEADDIFIKFIGDAKLSGLIIFGEMIKNPRIIDALVSNARGRGIPVMMFEHTVPGCINFQLDYASGFEAMVRHVVEYHDCKVVDMFAGFRGNPYSEERIALYKKVLEENGIEFEEMRVHYGDFWDAAAFNVLSTLLGSGYKIPQAFVCANDSMAIGVSDALKKHGYRIPEDCIVTGFDGIWKSEFQTPSITTCEPDYEYAKDMVLDILNSGDTTERDIKIGYRKLLRYSCGCTLDKVSKWPSVVSDLNSDNQDYFRHMLEMGRFISSTISMSDVAQAAQDLQQYLWLWKDQYYFIGIYEDGVWLHAVFEGRNGEYKYDRKFYHMPEVLPDMNVILDENSGINILLFKQIRSKADSFGYMVTGMDNMTMRDEQRFEEFSVFISAMVHAVVNNRDLINANKEIERMSKSDYLTGLYNRRGFIQEVGKSLKRCDNRDKWFTIFSADLDGLKSINDNYGHPEGDIAIKALAKAISTYVGKSGFCARYGGDEFAFAIIGDNPLSDKINIIRDKINDLIRQDDTVNNKRYRVKASIGCGEALINDKMNAEAIAHIADVEMYRDKYSKR